MYDTAAPRRIRQSTVLAWAVVAVGAIGAAGYAAAETELAELCAYAAVAGLALAAGIVGVRLTRPAFGPVWPPIFAGLAAWLAVDVARRAADVAGSAPGLPSAFDALHVAGALSILAGFVIGYQRSRRDGLGGLLEAAVVAICAALLLWVLVLDPELGGSPSPVVTALATGYPAVDVMVLALLVQIGVARRFRKLPAVHLFAAGAACVVAADVAQAEALMAGAADAGAVADVGRMLCFAAWGAAAAHPSSLRLARDEAVERLSVVRLAVLTAACLGVPAALVYQAKTAGLDPLMFGVSSSLLILMVFGRTMLIFRAQQRAEAELRRSRELYRTLVEGQPDCVKVVEADGTISMMNPAGLAMCGVGEEHVLGRRWDELVAPHDREVVAAAVASGIAGDAGRIEFDLPAPGGTRRLQSSTAPLRGPDGGVAALVSVTRDVTEQRALERTLEALFEHSLDAILIADDERVYLDANPAACALLDRPREEIVGRRMEEVIGGDPDAAAAAWQAFLAEGELRGEWQVERPDGSVRTADFAAKANLLPGRHLSILRDVTERRQLEEQLRQAQKMEAIGRLAGGIAHDFNNLLQAIGGYGQFALRKAAGDESLRRDLEEILRAGERASELTQQLLAFSRRQVRRPRVLDVNEVVEETESLLARLLGEDVRLACALAPEPVPVLADPGQLGQVLMNLAVNARDAMPSGGTLTIETAAVRLGRDAAARAELDPGPYALLAVRDTGRGMDEETRRRAFEPFFTTKEVGQGTGLGLATVYGIVRQSGGQITVESEPGRGSTFRILLPLVDAPAGRPEEAVEIASVGGSERVLLVEDEPLVRDLVATMLREHGYDVVACGDPHDALELGRSHDVALLVTDVVMPGMNGRELAERLLLERPGLAVVYTSGYPAQAIAERGVLPEGTAFLQKPFRLGELTSLVREVLDARVTAG